MHDTSMKKMRAFVEGYLGGYRDHQLEILDIGAQSVMEMDTYRPLFDSPKWHYQGLDLTPGGNVDIVVSDAYSWKEIPDASIDVVVSGQALEHIEFPWMTFAEINRILKPNGVVCIIAPSSGPEHRYPLDCWRIYPDGMCAFAKFADLEVVEVFTDWGLNQWQDTCAVLQKIRLSEGKACAPFVAQSDLGIAKKAFINALSTRPRGPVYYTHLAELLFQEERKIDAVVALRIGLEMSGGNAEVRQKLIYGLIDINKSDHASEHAIILLNARPISPANVGAAAAAYEHLNDTERRIFSEAIPTDVAALRRIATLAEAQHCFDLASACRKKLSEADTEDYMCLLNWAHSVYGSGDREGSMNLFRKAMDLQLQRKIINRTTVVQQIISVLKTATYLEIGVQRGLNFFQIDAPAKFAVDPDFKIPGGLPDNDRFYPSESDRFFEAVPSELAEKGLDVALVDGLHTYEQSLRDVENCLKILGPGGVIVMHDCLPASEAEACGNLQAARKMPGFTGEWTGDVYKAIVYLRVFRPDLFVCVLDADHGIGLVMRGKPDSMLSLSKAEISALGYDDLRRAAGELLNLKPADWFYDWLHLLKA